ncbi:MAG: flagellar biosynthesis protein FlhB [Treponema sp.]|jgi:flagellar biosynthetic protein FlhB|nr:flagellar biosynthesis protein FlhB [Treponema sp.]
MEWKDIDLQWFAAEDEGRTEQPSEHKLRKAREEGRIPKSQDLNSAIIMLLTVFVLLSLAPWLFKKFKEILRFFFSRCCELELTDGIIASAFYSYYFKMILPVAIVVIIAALAANIVQNKGFVFTVKPIIPNFSKIIPSFGKYLKKTLFSAEGAFNVAKSILKVAILVFISYTVIRNDLPQLMKLQTVSLGTGVAHIAKMAGKLLIIASLFFLVIAVFDYLMQRRSFMEEMKMTKQEVKEEYKELEGDPMIRGQIRQRMMQMLYQNLPKAVAEADVVITNPTHYACALKYDSETMIGPMLLAKGEDNTAQIIKRLAKENDIPIMENRPLARGLFNEVKIGQIIPEMYWQAIANILKVVYNMRGK